MSTEVAPWDVARLKSLRPALTLTTSAAPEETLATLDLALRQSGWTIRQRTTTSLQAREIEWFSVIAGRLNRCLLDLVVEAADTSGTRVVVRARSFPAGDPGRKKAARGLSDALRLLRQQGHTVHATDWYPADR
ncbi:hypothetical protein [Nocardioides sp.]|uniref:hypothetical protein n=1 Tax=Nocardioides sp. TaxID=35761 RepID=UPI002621A561|nr:hypothetical protein [Nocardioides sp.]